MVGSSPKSVSTPKRVNGWGGLGILAATFATMVAVIASVVSTGLATDSQVPESGVPLALTLPAIALLVALVSACWLLVDDHPGSAIGLSLVAAAWLLPALATWPLLTAQLRAGLLAAAPLEAAGVALVTGGWRPSPIRSPVLLLATMSLALAAAAVHLVGYDPFFDPACNRTCEAAPALLSNALGARPTIGLSAAIALAALLLAAVVSFRSSGAPKSLRVAGVVAATLVAGAAVVPSWRWGDSDNLALEDLLQTLGTGTTVATALGAALHIRRVRRNVRDVVAHLAGTQMVDRPLFSVKTVHFTVPDDGRWVDTAGRLVSTEAPQRYTILSDHRGGPSARLVLGRWAEPAAVLSSITPAGRLALENARLHAAAEFRLTDVQASQRRIVEATDLERMRIERDLHDGAQQRLVAVSMHLSSLCNNDGAAISDTLAWAEADVRAALAALRDLSHNSLPVVISAEGLEAAIEDLAATVPLCVDVQLAVDERRVAPAVQTAAYLAVASALDNVLAHARTNRAWVTLGMSDDTLVVTVSDGGRGGAVVGRGLTDVADRVGALGGSLELTSHTAEGTTMNVRLPCGW